LPLVKYHLLPSQFYTQGAKSAAIRRLASKVNIEELICVAKADFLGRTTDEAKLGVYEAGEWLLDKAKHLKVENRPLDNLLQGRDLIALGLEPSAEFKIILDEVYELQIEGEVNTKTEALTYIKKRINNDLY
jgi:tRNA nucleotidyltransferase (CCA-adding enzyme)